MRTREQSAASNLNSIPNRLKTVISGDEEINISKIQYEDDYDKQQNTIWKSNNAVNREEQYYDSE